ncbi:MAG: M28 family peptidase [Planctomycetota bacterium]|nr:M28 family peptidase [Planctomycetota bacterium]
MPIRRLNPCLVLLCSSLVAASAVAQAPADSLVSAPGSEGPDPVELLGEAPISVLLDSLGEDVVLYDMHIVTLANPFFEGRGATTIGSERAADYIEFHFKQIGLEPAFPGSLNLDGVDVESPNASYSQPFAPSEVRGSRGGQRPVKVIGSEASMRIGDGQWATLIPDLDYSVLGCSGTGEVEGELVFVGYSVPSGADGYLGYPPGTDLAGKIAVALRYEPLDADGASRWADTANTWSLYAQLEPKVSAAARRGAAGVIIVTPPGVAGEDGGKLATAAETAIGEFEIPVVMMSQERADFLLSRADAQGRTLLDLRKIVDESPAIIEMPGATVRLSTTVDRTPDMTRNMGGLLRGKGSLADEIVVIGAHFDHAGYGQYGGRERDIIHPGADDNASGTSAMLVAAKRLSEVYAAMPEDAEARSILFLAFSAEEWGLLGSKHYAANPIAPIEDHVFMLNMDMVGRVRDNVLMVGGASTAEGLDVWLEPFLSEAGFDYQPLPRGVFGRSDHASFFRKGVPCMFFFSGFHDVYHAPGDVAMLVNRVGGVRVSTLGQRIALAMATRPDRPVFTNDDGSPPRTDRPPETRPPERTRIRFGVQPGYTTDGKGVLIENVFPGTTAAQVGLQAGDILTGWNETTIKSVEDWMPMLQKATPGDEVKITFRRGDEELTGTGTLKAAGG